MGRIAIPNASERFKPEGWQNHSEAAGRSKSLYFFESALSPDTFWTDLNQIDFSKETGKALKLDLGVGQANVFAGNATRSYRASEPFPFAGLPR